MRLYRKVFFTGVMPGPSCFIRDRLVAVPARPIQIDRSEGLSSSSIHARINKRAGLDIDRRGIGAYGIVESRHNGRVFFSRMYGHDNTLSFHV